MIPFVFYSLSLDGRGVKKFLYPDLPSFNSIPQNP
ncbi:hypothetical protein Nhal_1334 [Nitrosococcus halophilus Nc 4]|uniref:Uncharacterized protein n=1 Tax=Nitrosococcus halophilus (strain Nc4) TaxID=472759 RepID=D5C0G0_NITHN|nr:hypothetical protein Nhal_1334 [Nitrosococcus halophilus Nc 4]